MPSIDKMGMLYHFCCSRLSDDAAKPWKYPGFNGIRRSGAGRPTKKYVINTNFKATSKLYDATSGV
jgi:hypothetical protein